MAQSEFDRKIEVITGILADLTVKQQLAGEHMNDWKERMARADERMEGFDERMNRAERRMIRVENILKLAIRAGRRERREWREKYAALVDAQMRSEAKLERVEEAVATVSEAQTRTEEAVVHMSQAQGRTEASISRLAEAQARTEVAQARTEEAMNRLAEAQASSDRTFEAFMNAVRRDVERRGGRSSEDAKDEGDGGES